MNPLFADSPLPRYAQLASVLRQRIVQGVWKKGDKLPSLDELVQEFSVATVTVRQAVELLARDGLLSPQAGRGTFVTAVPTQNRWLKLETSLDDLADVYRSDKPKLTLIEEASATPPLQAADGKAADSYHFMRRVHFQDNEPYSVISLYLDERIFKMAPTRFRNETVIPVLLDLPEVKIAKARQTVTILGRNSDGWAGWGMKGALTMAAQDACRSGKSTGARGSGGDLTERLRRVVFISPLACRQPARGGSGTDRRNSRLRSGTGPAAGRPGHRRYGRGRQVPRRCGRGARPRRRRVPASPRSSGPGCAGRTGRAG